ncbi:hypothetical protein KAU30_00135 [Candidatus Bathyarchaeota archaeon]|nr:hypothetical protein [Candidatus Bathyarchaeota archaeon]
MAGQDFQKKTKGLFIKGKFPDKEQLIKVAKGQAARLGAKGRVVVVDIGPYNSELEGQSVVVEYGSEYATSGRRQQAKN